MAELKLRLTPSFWQPITIAFNKIPWHFFQGLFTLIALKSHPLMAGIWAAYWIIYELNEDHHIHDKCYLDMPEFMWGLAAGIILDLIGVI